MAVAAFAFDGTKIRLVTTKAIASANDKVRLVSFVIIISSAI